MFKYIDLKTNQEGEWIKKKTKHNITLCCLKETHFKYEDTGKLKVKGWRKVYTQTLIEESNNDY